MIVPAKTLAMPAVERIPLGWVYKPLLGGRDPQFDYRLPSRSAAR